MTVLTVELEESLKTKLKIYAATYGKSLKQVSSEAFELYLQTQRNKSLQSKEN